MRWRNSRLHRRCDLCQHSYTKLVGVELRTLWLCDAKDKCIINCLRPFCPLYKAKEYEEI